MLIPGKDDGMVPVDSAKMKSENFKIIDNATHTSILKDTRTMKEISNFLKNTTIQENKAEEKKIENFSEKRE